MSKNFPSLGDKVFEPFNEPDFWKKVKPREGAIEAIKTLIECGHEIFIVTNTTHNIERKFADCLFKYFPFLSWDNLILTKRKDVVDLDILIDDYPMNFNGCKCQCLLFNAHYNKDISKLDIKLCGNGTIQRVCCWSNIVDTIMGDLFTPIIV